LQEATLSRPELRRAAVFAFAAIAVLIAVWAVMHHGPYGRETIIDTPVYQRYGDAMADGKVPYRDFGLEYPPGALPVFAVPALGTGGDWDAFVDNYGIVMQACGALALLAVAAAALALRASRRRLALALAGPALLPLALGSVFVSRFDLWPAAITAVAVAAFLFGRWRIGAFVLGLAFVTKVYPGVLLPLALAAAWQARGRREAVAVAGWFAGATALVLVPFLALSPSGVWDMVVRQTTRPLQVESLASGILLAAHQAFDVDIEFRSGHGSQNLAGTLPDVLGSVQTLVQVLVVVALWIGFARGRLDRERLIRGSAALVCAFIAFGKVISPQFLIWLLPLVPLVGGRRGVRAGVLLLAACLLTQAWFPFRYWDLVAPLRTPGAEPDALASWLVLVRDLVLLALLWTLAGPELRDTAGRAARWSARALPRRTR
jgi:hypothetical protein